jgi:hypothetical protein
MAGLADEMMDLFLVLGVNYIGLREGQVLFWW